MTQLNHAHWMIPVVLELHQASRRGDLDEVKRLVEEKKTESFGKKMTMETLPFTSLLRVVTWT